MPPWVEPKAVSSIEDGGEATHPPPTPKTRSPLTGASPDGLVVVPVDSTRLLAAGQVTLTPPGRLVAATCLVLPPWITGIKSEDVSGVVAAGWLVMNVLNVVFCARAGLVGADQANSAANIPSLRIIPIPARGAVRYR